MKAYRESDAEDPHHLDRFVQAQEGVYEDALAELVRGRKETHWMWFIFPQLLGLGTSPMAQRYAIRSLDEARAYLRHPVLGERLIECSQAILKHHGQSARSILGTPDDLKLRSSATLFSAAASDLPEFRRMLVQFYDGREDDRTLELLRR